MAVYGLEQLNSNAQKMATASVGKPVYNGGTNNATAGRTTRSPSDLSSQTPTGGQFKIPSTDAMGDLQRSQPPAQQQPQPSPVGTYFDPMIAAAERRLQESQGQLTADFNRSKSQVQQDNLYSQNVAERQHQQALKYLQDQLASQGILRSGINIAEQGRMGEQQQDYMYQLQSELNNQLNSLQSMYNQGMQQTYTGLEQLMQQKASQESQWQMQEAQRIAQEQANQKHLKDLEALVRTTQPTVTPTGKIQTTGNVKGDQAYLNDEQALMGRISDIFTNRGVSIAAGNETEQQRLQRIAQEVMSGKRDLGDVRNSVANIGKREAEELRRQLGLVNV